VCCTDHEELVEVITSSGALFSPWQASWLKALTTTTAIDAFGATQQPDTTNNAAAGASIQQQQQPVVPGFLPPAGQAGGLVVGAGSTSSTSAERLPFDQLGMDEEQLWAAVGEHTQCARAGTLCLAASKQEVCVLVVVLLPFLAVPCWHFVVGLNS
jgi:hypothetical protein